MFGGGIGTGEIVIIFVVALLIFGPKKLPEMGRAIGSAVTQFKKGIASPVEEDSKPATAQIEEPGLPEADKEPSGPVG